MLCEYAPKKGTCKYSRHPPGPPDPENIRALSEAGLFPLLQGCIAKDAWVESLAEATHGYIAAYAGKKEGWVGLCWVVLGLVGWVWWVGLGGVWSGEHGRKLT